MCAPTGTAAFNIKGATIHYTFKIHVSDYLNYADLPSYKVSQLRKTFRHVHTVIIDEISMVGDKMLTFISCRLSEIKSNEQVFGGMNVITVGDFFQLKPIKSKYAFHNHLIWHLFHVIFLMENMRQTEDLQYAQLLNRARLGLLEMEHFPTEDPTSMGSS